MASPVIYQNPRSVRATFHALVQGPMPTDGPGGLSVSTQHHGVQPLRSRSVSPPPTTTSDGRKGIVVDEEDDAPMPSRRTLQETAAGQSRSAPITYEEQPFLSAAASASLASIPEVVDEFATSKWAPPRPARPGRRVKALSVTSSLPQLALEEILNGDEILHSRTVDSALACESLAQLSARGLRSSFFSDSDTSQSDQSYFSLAPLTPPGRDSQNSSRTTSINSSSSSSPESSPRTPVSCSPLSPPLSTPGSPNTFSIPAGFSKVPSKPSKEKGKKDKKEKVRKTKKSNSGNLTFVEEPKGKKKKERTRSLPKGIHAHHWEAESLNTINRNLIISDHLNEISHRDSAVQFKEIGASSALRPLVHLTMNELQQSLATLSGRKASKDPSTDVAEAKQRIQQRLQELHGFIEELLTSYDELQTRLSDQDSNPSFAPGSRIHRMQRLSPPASRSNIYDGTDPIKSLSNIEPSRSAPVNVPLHASAPIMVNSTDLLSSFSSPSGAQLTSPKQRRTFRATLFGRSDALRPEVSKSGILEPNHREKEREREREKEREKERERERDGLSALETFLTESLLAMESESAPQKLSAPAPSSGSGSFIAGLRRERRTTVDPYNEKNRSGSASPTDGGGNSIGYTRFTEILEALPDHELRIARAKANARRYIITGPDDREAEECFGGIASAWATSTYPALRPPKRMGDPICDRFLVQIEESNVLLALADGCNWGSKPREAAILASNDFVNSLSAQLREQEAVITSRALGVLLLKSVMRAHQKILEPNPEPMECGTTTLLGGIILPLENPFEVPPDEDGSTGPYMVVFASVGDCRAFLYSRSTGRFTEVTKRSRQGGNMNDCGGRLGPARGTPHPDLRNLMLCSARANQGDVLVAVSDGVHDNLSPDVLGLRPQDVSIDANDWAEATSKFPELTQLTVQDFQLRMLNHFARMAWGNSPVLEPHKLTEVLINHCKTVTHAVRNYMETTPNSSQPDDYQNYPGKMDHTTCVALKVGKPPKNPYVDLPSILAAPMALAEFRDYLMNDPQCKALREQYAKCGEQVDPVVDLAFYEAIEKLFKSEDSISPDSVMKLCGKFFGLSVSSLPTQDLETVALNANTRKDMSVSLRTALGIAQREVLTRLEGRYFRGFCQSWWMLEGWVRRPPAPNRPLPPIPPSRREGASIPSFPSQDFSSDTSDTSNSPTTTGFLSTIGASNSSISSSSTEEDLFVFQQHVPATTTTPIVANAKFGR